MRIALATLIVVVVSIFHLANSYLCKNPVDVFKGLATGICEPVKVIGTCLEVVLLAVNVEEALANEGLEVSKVIVFYKAANSGLVRSNL